MQATDGIPQRKGCLLYTSVAGVELPSKLYDVKALADELAGAYRAAVEASEAPHA